MERTVDVQGIPINYKLGQYPTFRSRYYEIEIEADVAEALHAHARQKGVTVSNLASDLLRQQLATA